MFRLYGSFPYVENLSVDWLLFRESVVLLLVVYTSSSTRLVLLYRQAYDVVQYRSYLV
jgi:hypothetical protein